MMNLMRADMYRILRGKAVYISLAVMVLLAALVVFVFRIAPATGIITEEDVFVPVAENYMTGAMGAELAIGGMNNIAFIFLVGIVVTAMAAFSSGAVKNELTIGIGRTKFYFSKWLLTCLLSISAMLIFLAMFIIFATFVDGFGYWGDGYLAEVLTSFGLQSILAIAFSSIGVFFSFVTRKAAAVNGLYIAFMLVPTFIIALLAEAFPRAMDFVVYDMSFLFGVFATAANQPTADIVRGVIIGLGYILVSTVAGVLLFRKAEIR